jgi:hypothetical protein
MAVLRIDVKNVKICEVFCENSKFPTFFKHFPKVLGNSGDFLSLLNFTKKFSPVTNNFYVIPLLPPFFATQIKITKIFCSLDILFSNIKHQLKSINTHTPNNATFSHKNNKN